MQLPSPHDVAELPSTARGADPPCLVEDCDVGFPADIRPGIAYRVQVIVYRVEPVDGHPVTWLWLRLGLGGGCLSVQPAQSQDCHFLLGGSLL